MLKIYFKIYNKMGRSRKDPYSPPPWRKFLPSGRGGEKKLFLIIINVLGHPKGVGGLTSYFLCGGGIHGCFLE